MARECYVYTPTEQPPITMGAVLEIEAPADWIRDVHSLAFRLIPSIGPMHQHKVEDWAPFPADTKSKLHEAYMKLSTGPLPPVFIIFSVVDGLYSHYGVIGARLDEGINVEHLTQVVMLTFLK